MAELKTLLHNLLLANRVSIDELKTIESRDPAELREEERYIERRILLETSKPRVYPRDIRLDTRKSRPTNPRPIVTTEKGGRHDSQNGDHSPPPAIHRTVVNDSFFTPPASNVATKRFVVLPKVSERPIKPHPDDTQEMPWTATTNVEQHTKPATARKQVDYSSHGTNSDNTEQSQGDEEEENCDDEDERSIDLESWNSDPEADLMAMAGKPPQARAHFSARGTNSGSPGKAQLYRWKKAPEDTATWLYNLVFSDTVPDRPFTTGRPVDKINNRVQGMSDRKVATLNSINGPKIVEQLLLQWTPAPNIIVAQDRLLAGLTNEEMKWKGAIDQNVTDMLTEETGEPYLSGGDSDGSRPRSRSRQRVPRTTSPFRPHPPPPLPRDPRVDSYPYTPPPMFSYGNLGQLDAEIKTIKELLLNQERHHVETKYRAEINALKETHDRVRLDAEAETFQAKERAKMAASIEHEREKARAEARAIVEKAKAEREAQQKSEAEHAARLREERDRAIWETKERTEKIKCELEAKGAKMVAECEAKHKEEMEKQAMKLEAGKYTIGDLIDVIHVVGHPSSTWDHTASVEKLHLRAHFNPSDKKLVQQHAIHGTLLWTPPATPAICEMYEKLKEDERVEAFVETLKQ